GAPHGVVRPAEAAVLPDVLPDIEERGLGTAGPAIGMTPICVSIGNIPCSAQCSTARPSRNRPMLALTVSNRRPVAGNPSPSPVCVPVVRNSHAQHYTCPVTHA